LPFNKLFEGLRISVRVKEANPEQGFQLTGAVQNISVTRNERRAPLLVCGIDVQSITAIMLADDPQNLGEVRRSVEIVPREATLTRLIPR
jgi:hypothetical protein